MSDRECRPSATRLWEWATRPAPTADDENEIDGDADPGRPPGQPMAAGLAGVGVVVVMQALAHGVFADGGFGAAARLIYTGS